MKTFDLAQKLIKKLNPRLAQVIQIHRKVIRLKTANNYIVSIILTSDEPDVNHGKHDTLIFDHNGQVLKSFLKLEKFPVYNDIDKNNFVKTSKKILESLCVKTKKDALKMVTQSLHFFELSKNLISYFNLNYKLENEYFSFGNDEYRPRFYKDVKRKDILNKKIRILDKGAFIFDNHSVDLMVGLNHATKTKFYPDVRLKYKEVSMHEKHDFVSINSKKGTTIYYQNLKPSKKQLKGQRTIPIKNIYNQIFTFVNTPEGYALKDNKGKVFKLSHPDLHFYVID